jgi:hypothetical protein
MAEKSRLHALVGSCALIEGRLYKHVGAGGG